MKFRIRIERNTIITANHIKTVYSAFFENKKAKKCVFCQEFKQILQNTEKIKFRLEFLFITMYIIPMHETQTGMVEFPGCH